MKVLLLASLAAILSTSAFAQGAAPVPTPAAPAIAADDIQRQITLSMSEYQQKNYGKAADALDAASEKMRKMKADILTQYLPKAPQGWTEIKSENEASSLGMMGMGSMIERSYQSGGGTVTISMITDNKLMGAISSLANLGQTLGAADGKNQFMGYTYMYSPMDPKKPYDKENSAQLIVSEKLTIRASGSKMTEQQAQGFFGLIDLAKLKAEADK